MTVSFRDSDGTTRLSGDLLASGGAIGDVLTQQADGTFAPAAGGGGSSTEHATYRGNNVSIPNSGAATSLTWDTLVSGDALLDLSVPTAPTIVTGGVYVVTVNTFPASGMADDKAYGVNLFVNGGEVDQILLKETRAVEDSFDFDTWCAMSVAYLLAAGSFLTVQVQQADAGAVNFALNGAYIQRLS